MSGNQQLTTIASQGGYAAEWLRSRASEQPELVQEVGQTCNRESRAPENLRRCSFAESLLHFFLGPIGKDLQELRRRSPSLAAFVNTAAGISRPEDLAALLKNP